MCNDYRVGPFTYNISADDNLFSIVSCFFYIGPVSFGLMAPDGTCLNYLSYAGETGGWNKYSYFIDNGSAYDGIYTDDDGRNFDPDDPFASIYIPGVWYIAHDSIKGMIVPGDFISLMLPAGGETWSASANHEIRWTSMGVETVRLDYSPNGGQSWTMIADDIAADSSPYAWTIPNDISDNCIVRISDTTGTVEPDTSDQFSIVAPYITITAPLSGSSFETGVVTNITWVQDGNESLLIEYSPNGGSTWEAVASDVPASVGKVSWTPQSETDEGLIRITSLDHAGIFTVSDDVFSIRDAYIEILWPEPEVILTGGGETVLDWNSSDSVEAVDIYFSDDGGSTWTVVKEAVVSSEKQYTWQVPNISSVQCMIRIIDADTPIVSDTSSIFTIQRSLDYWRVYDTSNSIGDNRVPSIAVDSSGGIWFATRFGGGAAYFDGQEWTIYNTKNCSMESDDVCIVAVDHNDVAWFGTSNGHLMSFDGTNWINYYDSPMNIHKLVFDRDNNLWITTYGNGICFCDTRTMSYTIFNSSNSPVINDIPLGIAIDSDNAVWVGYYIDRGVHRISDGTWEYFDDPIGVSTISIDNDNTVWFASSLDYTGVWSYDGEQMTSYPVSNLVCKRVWISAVDYDGKVWFGGIGGATSFDGTEWQNYTQDNSAMPHIEVHSIAAGLDNTIWFGTNGGGVASYIHFTGPYIRVAAPNGSETWATGEAREIKWQSFDIDTVDVEYSADGGQSWVILANNVDADQGSYSWVTPGESSTEYLVLITASDDESLWDTSNGPFTITDPFLRITSPNGGEQWAAGSEYTVRWVSLGVNAGTLSFSPDAGETWDVVDAGVDLHAGRYVWQIPDIISGTCLLRLADNIDTGIADVSDGQFSLTPPYLTVIYPNGGEDFDTSGMTGIIWESHGYDTVDLSFSVDGGKSWNQLKTGITASIGRYDWNPPNVTTRLCLVKVSAASEPDTYDTSDGVFDLINNVITDVDEIMPETFSVRQNYPNPFNPSTTITYSLPEGDYTRIEVFDVTGRIVETIVDEWRDAGRHSIVWDASDQSAGLYFCRVVSGANSEVMKMMLLK